MTNEQKLKANIAAAKLLGYEPHVLKQCFTMESVIIHDSSGNEREFSLSNPADLMAVVIKLGEEHSISILSKPANDRRDWRFCFAEGYGYSEGFSVTYEQAVGAACIEVMGENDD